MIDKAKWGEGELYIYDLFVITENWYKGIIDKEQALKEIEKLNEKNKKKD